MNAYQVLARKLRPQVFRDVVAQEAIVTTLKNSIAQARVAHAYLFCGSRGTGKTTLARLFAKAMNCPNITADFEPCNSCSSCRDITLGHAIDVLEIDGASHRGIEDIRQIKEATGFCPVGKGCKIYLIDEVHMLTKEAFNALLKTLEEPPLHVKFFFCTTEPHKIPATILSRCVRFNLRRIPPEKIAIKLDEILADLNVVREKEALEIISEMSEGSLRDALSLLDQILCFEKEKITKEVVETALGLPSKEMLIALGVAGANHDLSAAFKVTEYVFSSGKNISYFLEELIHHFRSLLWMKNGMRVAQAHTEIASFYRIEQLIQILEILTEGQQTIKSAPSERTALEMLLLKILRTHQQIPLESLVQRLIALENEIGHAKEPNREEQAKTPSSFSSSSHTLSVAESRALEDPEGLRDSSTCTAKGTYLQLSPHSALKSQDRGVAQVHDGEKTAKSTTPLSIQEQSRFDTVMRFAAKELNGSFIKEEE